MQEFIEKNRGKYENVKMSVGGQVTPYYFMTPERIQEVNKLGPCGWYGCTGPTKDGGGDDSRDQKPVYKSYYLQVEVPVKKDQIESLVKDIYHQGGKSHRDDKGLWYYTKPIVTKEEEYKYVTRPKVITKKPCFDDVLKAIQKHDPNFTEEDLIEEDEDSYGEPEFNKLVISDIVPEKEVKEVISETEYDKDRELLVICCMNDDIPRYENDILSRLQCLSECKHYFVL